ncbi:UDP-N-acetylglucosamine 2-epimerase [Vibrio lentus]|uniref:non-hydrolyzing UDP-N-acetylglucosamine 2-epimerase n=1 Tax=Vibrio lentus TaxID=136468 RepID=UPI000C841939|nr:UDP-N-acetylglucosamine 2-epimerase (non-hydrolyzing) [Vibrio lentus]PMI06652.1 UDP-N-acetylglucosamine 2-epimerase [Vibrio lentus]PML02530.1 UDP-N-acetylglucosamine 2-epimerase [Vibrio lentus]
MNEKTKKVLVVFGTRPEAIKMAPLVKTLEHHSEFINMKVCVTAQHREMLDQVLELFEITPDYDLDIMKQGQDLFDVTSRVLMGMRSVLDDYQPDIVLVHGDTTTTIGASLAAFYKQIPVGHVEAGLRTNDIYSPWPEEANRKLTSQITQYHFAPTQLNLSNLEGEGVPKEKIIVTGNTVIDSLLITVKKIHENESVKKSIEELFSVEGYTFTSRKIVLVTGHRRENFGNGFLNICTALKKLSELYPDVDFVYPVHLNPNVQEPVNKLLRGIDNVYLIDPVGYLPFVYLLDKSFLILTDSGGVQEEAPSLGKPVLVMRDTTERPEAVSAGTVALVGTGIDSIISNVSELLNSSEKYLEMSVAHNPYGNGTASQVIVDFLIGEK